MNTDQVICRPNDKLIRIEAGWGVLNNQTSHNGPIKITHIKYVQAHVMFNLVHPTNT